MSTLSAEDQFVLGALRRAVAEALECKRCLAWAGVNPRAHAARSRAWTS